METISLSTQEVVRLKWIWNKKVLFKHPSYWNTTNKNCLLKVTITFTVPLNIVIRASWCNEGILGNARTDFIEWEIKLQLKQVFVKIRKVLYIMWVVFLFLKLNILICAAHIVKRNVYILPNDWKIVIDAKKIDFHHSYIYSLIKPLHFCAYMPFEQMHTTKVSYKTGASHT